MNGKTQLPVSLVIPCFNRREKTHRLLSSLNNADFGCEIILIDDCSTEDLESVIEDHDNIEVRYYRNQENMGPAYSRNRGVELATHDIIAFTDNDCEVSKDWLLRLHEYLINSPSKYIGVGGKVIAKGNDIFSQYFTYHKILDPWYYQGRYMYLVTANAIFRKEPLLAVGGFDESIRGAGGEDPGLCFKLLNKGYEFLYNSEAIIIHDYPKGFRNLYQVFFRYGFGCRKQAEKYFKKSEHTRNTAFGGQIWEDSKKGQA